MILQRKLNLEERDKNGKTPLMLARNHNNQDIVKLLQEEIKKRSRYNSVRPILETWYEDFQNIINVSHFEKKCTKSENYFYIELGVR